MASILVVEQEQRSVERINQALGGEGWRVRVVPGRVQALQAAASEAPDLVLLSSDVPGAEELASSFQRSAGGPGVVVILPERAEVGSGSLPADDRLARPFTDQDLRIVVRRAMAVRRQGAGAAAAAPSQVRLTSQDIFGDVLAEVEGQVPLAAGASSRLAAPAATSGQRPGGAAPGTPAQGSTPTSAQRTAAFPPPSSGKAAAPASGSAGPRPPSGGAREGGDDEMARRLEQTLSGVFQRPRPAPAAQPRKEAPAASSGSDEIDALLSKTLSKLELPTRPKAPAPVPQAPQAAQPAPPAQAAAPAPPLAPAAPPPAAASPVAATAAPVPRPALVPRPAAAAPAVGPAAAPPAAAAAAAPPAAGGAAGAQKAAAAPAPQPAQPVQPAQPPVRPSASRSTGSVNLAELEDLARTRRRPGGEGSRPGVSEPREPKQPGESSGPAQAPGRPPLQSVPPLAPRTQPPAPPQGSRSVGAADAAATQRIPVVPREEAGDKPGERFGQYTLLEKIAVGGMAEVWKARMRGVEGFQKTVAIKKILPYMTDSSEFVAMFIDEAKLAAQLSHPNIIHIYDLGKIGRDFYIAMEYVEGKDLRSLLNGARRLGLHLPFGLALLIAARLAGALEYAHNKRDFEGRGMGLVHRDVSPQNVLLSLDGDVKLCDFGIAKAVSKAGQTQMGALKGKLQYMSPEQAWGKPVDHRSDIFSLGSVLFELLTGERLFSGDTEMSVLESVRQARVRSPRQIDPTIPREIDEVVVRALATLPEERFQSAGEVEQRLEAVLYALKPSPSHTDLAAFVRQVALGETSERAVESHPAPAAPPRPAAVPATDSGHAGPAVLPHQVAPATAMAGAPGLEVAPLAPVGEVRVEEGGRQGRMILIAAIAALVVLAVLTFVFLSRRKAAPGEPPKAGVAGPVQPPARQAGIPGQPQPAGTPGGPVSPAAAAGGAKIGVAPGAQSTTAKGALTPPKVDVEGMVGQEVAKQAEAMKQKFEDQKKQLEKQIAQSDANKTPGTGAAKQAAGATGATGSLGSPGAVSSEPGRQTAPAGAGASAQPAAGQPAASEAPARAASPPAAPAAEGEASTDTARGQERAPATRRAEAGASTVKVGDLVNPGTGVTPPALVSVPKPEYPPVARKLHIQGVVVVSVLVDENGNPEDVKISESAAQNAGLNEAAIVAARSARYKPATKDGVRVKMWTRLKIPFKP
jgi:TonB family protein